MGRIWIPAPICNVGPSALPLRAEMPTTYLAKRRGLFVDLDILAGSFESNGIRQAPNACADDGYIEFDWIPARSLLAMLALVDAILSPINKRIGLEMHLRLSSYRSGTHCARAEVEARLNITRRLRSLGCGNADG